MNDTPEGQCNLYESDRGDERTCVESIRWRMTEDKLAVLREYLKFYTIALKGRFDLIYIDTSMCGTHFGLTKLVTSISRKSAACSPARKMRPKP